MNGAASLSDLSAAAASASLTPRQKEILAMLKAGKANKEIANELGIGVGTVKQHVVALFKKLGARNRTMAVSQGQSLLGERPAESPTMTVATGRLERRPCVVLSVSLPADAPERAVARLNAVLAAQASEHDAVFLARQGNAGDVIFGIQRTTEYDLVKAVRIARAVRKEFASKGRGEQGRLRIALAAGIAMASMGRFGGWTGEAMASGALAAARELVSKTKEGFVSFGAGARELMASCGMGPVGDADLDIEILDRLVWTGERRRYTMVGREREMATLRAALRRAQRGSGKVVFVEGETGMGKSRLLSALVDSSAVSTVFLRCLPGEDGDRLREIGTGLIFSAAELTPCLAKLESRLVVVDDTHFLTAPNWNEVLACARQLATQGVLVVLAGRRGGDEVGPGVDLVRLGRLDDAAIAKLVAAAVQGRGQAADGDMVRSIVAMASGVPFFATEMASHGGMTLPVFAIVCARLDGLHQDHRLLHAVAKATNADIDALAGRWGEDQEALRREADRAVAAGILRRTGLGKLTFSHPLLRMALNYMGTDAA